MLLVQMPKTATTALAAHLGQLHQHRRAVELPAGPKFGVLRHPLAWYRSWYGHVARWGESNERCVRALDGLGRGDRSFIGVLWGLTHLDEIDRDCLPASDHLFAPGGLVGARSMYAAHLDWWFRGDAGAWAVDELVCLELLRDLGVEVENEGPGLAGEAYNLGWMLEDIRTYIDARSALVRHDSRASAAIAARRKWC